MEFNPANNVVRLCLQGMDMEEKANIEEARKLFLQAWNDASDDFEKFTAAHYVARHQANTADNLKWHETGLQLALRINDDTVNSALPALYRNIAKCYEELGDADRAQKNYDMAASITYNTTDKGPFYHGTRAGLQVGNFLTAGRMSNYYPDVIMNHIYFTAMVNGAGFAAALAKGDGAERVYVVEPTGAFENDPNVTDKKFPGNPTRSYRTKEPLKIIGEVTEWARLTPEQIQQFKEKLASSKGEIIN